MRRLLVLVATLSLAGGGGVVHAQAPDPTPGGDVCPQPFEPWFSGISLYGTEPQPPRARASFDVEPPAVDMDGDGQADVVAGGGGAELRVARGDGELVLRAGAGSSLYADSAGDLDGDGRSELFVADLGAGGGPSQFVVPGTTPVGTVDLADVGIRVEVWEQPSFNGSRRTPAAGDHDGDGAGDLVQIAPVQSTPRGLPTVHLLSGADVMAAGPGGDATAVEPFDEVVGLLGMVQLAPGTPTFIAGEVVDGGLALTVGSEPPVALRTSPAAPPTNPGGSIARAHLIGDDRVVEVSYGDRSGTDRILWNLDDPCARWAAEAPALPTTPPAEPVVGTPTYTG